MKRENGRNHNNKGFSMVELIIAVVILAIATIPMYRLFIVGARTNGKSKSTLMATSVGQDVMEGLASMKLKELAYQANYPSLGIDIANLGSNITAHELKKDPSGNFTRVTLGSPDNGTIATSGGIEVEDVMSDPAVTSSILSYDNGNTYKFNRTGGAYYFSIENMELRNKRYDALISLTPSADITHTYSGSNEPQISNLNTNYDAFYMENTVTMDTILSRIQTLYSSSITKSDISRTITIDVTKAPDISGEEVTQATILYQYTFMYNGALVTYPSADDANKTLLYDNSENTALSLKNIYLFYLPHYESTQVNAEKDRIVVNNRSNVKFALNLIKQKSVDADLEAREFNYKVLVDVEENTLHEKGYMSIKTNLDKNLANESVTQPVQATYEYNGDLVQSTVRTRLSIGDLTKSESRVKLYEVTVEIFEAGAGSEDPSDKKVYKDHDNLKLATLTGGMND